MTTPGSPLPIHSLTEARLYLNVTPCSACDKGPLIADPNGTRHDPEQHTLSTPITCKACRHALTIRFDTRQIEQRGPLCVPAEPLASNDQTHPPLINPTDEPSEIIDVVGWVTLHAALADAARTSRADARTTPDRSTARRKLIEAGQCLDEALKFFEIDNDLPPEEAFFTDTSRRHFRDHPELFTRQRLIDLLRQLPR